MTRIAIAALAAFAITGGVQAADLGARRGAPVMPIMAAFNWTGFYVGANAGYAWGDHSTRIGLGGNWAAEGAALRNRFVNDGGGNTRLGGFTGGLQAGYNHQMGNFVLGAEGDVGYLGLNKRSTVVSAGVPTYTFTKGAQTSWIVTLRPRIGFAMDRTLFYATGGLAIADLKNRWSVVSSGNYLKAENSSTVRVGWTLGAGVEHAFLNNISAKLEYLYTDLGRVSKTSAYLPGSAFPGYSEQLRTRLTFHTVRVGVNYRF